MFTKTLGELTLTGELAAQIFGSKIYGDNYRDDTSFVATLRALLIPRIGDHRLRLRNTAAGFSRSAIENANRVANVYGALVSDLRDDEIVICNANATNDDDRKAIFDYVDHGRHGFLKHFSGFEELKDIREFVSPVMNARFYTNAERRTTVIFVERLDMKKYHYLQSFTPRYFRWYFESAPLTQDDENLLRSLIRRTSEEYEVLIEEFASKLNMRDYMIRNMLGDFERRAKVDQLDGLQNQLEDLMRDMQNLMDQYSRACEKKDTINLQCMGLREAINSQSEESELMDYFIANRNLDPVATDSGRFSFIVRTYLDSFDPDLYDSMSKRETSLLFIDYSVGIRNFREVSARKRLLDAIFSDDPVLRIKMCAFYQIDIRGHVSSYSGYSFPANCRDMLPNPHLHYHNCLGNHMRYITERLGAGDIVGAIEQCVSSAKSINIGEGPTIRYFLKDLFSTHAKIIELPDGTSVEPLEALKWLEKQESTEVETHGEAD